MNYIKSVIIITC